MVGACVGLIPQRISLPLFLNCHPGSRRRNPVTDANPSTQAHSPAARDPTKPILFRAGNGFIELFYESIVRQCPGKSLGYLNYALFRLSPDEECRRRSDSPVSRLVAL